MLLRALCIAGAAALLASAASADVVKLKNGETLEGVVTSKTSDYVVLKVAGGEMGFPAALVDSVDTTKGPNASDLAKQEDESRKRAELYLVERAEAKMRRDAARAAEASARRTEDAAAEPVTAAPSVDYAADARARLDAIEEAVSQVTKRRERNRVRWALYRYYFGVPDLDLIRDLPR